MDVWQNIHLIRFLFHPARWDDAGDASFVWSVIRSLRHDQTSDIVSRALSRRGETMLLGATAGRR